MQADAYSCAVTNRFGELLDDEADPFDLINDVETEKEKDKKKKKKKKEEEKKNQQKEKKPGQKETQRDRRLQKEVQEPLTGRKLEQSHHESEATREEVQRGMKRSAAGQQMEKQEACPQDYYNERPLNQLAFDPRGRGGFRGKRRGRWTQNFENTNMRERRDFDRQNRTGFSPEEKRGGRGPWNWGSVEDAAKEVMDVTSDNNVNKSMEPQNSVEENPNDMKHDDSEEMVVQVAMEMSLDEWKAMQENTRPKAEFNLRKAEDKIPTKAKVIHQSKCLENLKITSEDLEDGHFLRRSVNDITSLLDINFGSLGRPSRGRGRGARGGGPGQSGSGRLERPTSLKIELAGYAPNPDDPEDFPALSGGK